MKSRFNDLLLILCFYLISTATLQAAVEIELTDGNRITADRIQWGPSATLVLETSNKGQQEQQTIPLDHINRLSIDGSHYDQQTIQIAAANPDLIHTTHTTSVPNLMRDPFSPSEYETETAPPPFLNQPNQIPYHSSCNRGVIIGIHDDPLDAYVPLVHQYYPEGVPTLERGYALGLMRNLVVQQAWESSPASDRFPPPPEQAPISGKLANIGVQATPLNTRGKADWNALAIRVQGFDRRGNPARISGTVHITLYGQRQQLLHVWDQQFAVQPVETMTLANWTCNSSSTPETQTPRVGNRFGAGQPNDQTWIVRLPAPTPEHNLNVYALGEVQVTLTSPGNGVFEASSGAVPLRHLSQPRDSSLAQTGTRFFPSEVTSEGISRMSRLNFNSPLRPNSRALSIQP
ncbi:hypothetical protein [Gimesia aquarii]|uniref:SLA1 homology domain-containing protein n=1 Tax=Gimesia aquarii TaxID=2527964 RepID=A0A517WQI9_9PLAN|nr:hypothetical protein [Gimesia aquarii]QDU07514.1 hypothetical protein V202x_08710 [Gimesia aquarii]